MTHEKDKGKVTLKGKERMPGRGEGTGNTAEGWPLGLGRLTEEMGLVRPEAEWT